MALLSSLSNRIFLASAALTVVCMGIAVYLVNARVAESADLELQRELVQTGEAVDQQRATVSDSFAVIARVVADLPKLKALVDTNDPPTVRPIAAEYRDQVGSDLFLVTNRSGGLLASIESLAGGTTNPASLDSVRDALAGREGAQFLAHPHGVLQVVSVPVTAPASSDVLGTLTVGFLLDDRLARKMKNLTGSEVAFAANGHVLASSLPAADRHALESVLHTRGVSSVWVGGNEYLALLRPLAPTQRLSLLTRGTAPRVSGPARSTALQPLAVLLRSRTDRLRFLRPIRTALGVTALGFVLVAIGVSYAIARTITRPIGSITTAMREMTATGDLTRKIAWPDRRWEDEDARLLATTFNTLTDSVTRFQREAAERERLSALGRLSTVIAHEVRNPLMIIKASLPPLTREGATPEEVREAVADIDEEVRRLNRLVTDVLDFARPLRFDFAPADVNRLCEESAAAATATADRGGPAIGLALDPHVPVVVTDAERLRAALVNLLVNARHAVEARAAAGPSPDAGAAAPGVELATQVAAGGRIAIVVRDRGAGIAPADLPRVFEPYFTTRRGGTGLGLAITRNIVEGLGGTIAIASQPGVGTDVRIELPID